ncbi:LamG-like jellyroll fold domain-containing protein [Solirubrum puertoriconensis]|nr:LamG-like jellyroll fold domain-containing protein [Solirubrum puertoriconensis]
MLLNLFPVKWNPALAQSAASYSFSTETGYSLESMSGGTLLIAPNSSFGSVAPSPFTFPSSFAFKFGATTYTQAWVNGSGVLRFGNTAPSPWSDFPTAENTPAVAALATPQTMGSDGGVYYRLVGVSPNRRLVVEWGGASTFNSPSSRRYQVWLYESSNAVRFVYGPNTFSNGTPTTIGIATSATEYLTVNPNTHTASSSSIEPANGVTLTNGRSYRFAPPPPNLAPTDISLTNSSVAENQLAGTTVGTLGTTDADGAGQTHTYELVSGTGSADNGSFSIVGNSLRTASIFDFETKSSYSIRVRVTDNGVPVGSFEETFTIFVTDQPDVSARISSQTNVTCYGGRGGSATVSVSGGTSPYTYVWEPSGGSGSTANNLFAGNYLVRVTDRNGLQTSAQVTITQPPALQASMAQTNISCNGVASGSATVTVSGGTPGYTYNWSPGNPTGDGTNRITGLIAGTYSVLIRDANGCEITRDVTITQPSAIVTTSSQTNVTTSGGTDGSATIGLSGGTAPYTYSWAPSGGTSATASGLRAGNYTVTATDANGCSVTRNYTITQPQPGNALHFDGTNDYVVLPQTVQGNFTLEFWLNTTQTAPQGTQWYQGVGLLDAEVGGVTNDFGTALLENKVAFGMGNPDITIQSATAVNDGRWHHVAAVRNGSTMQLYIDGKLEASNSSASNAPRNVPNRLVLGSMQTLVNGYFSGRFDEVRIWNTARTAAEIQANYATPLSPSQAGLVAYYTFEHGMANGTNTSQNLLDDVTANTYFGTLTNFGLTGSTSNWVESYAMVVPTATAATAISSTGFTANWTAPAVGSVTNYLLEVSTSNTFASQISGSPFSVAGNSTSRAITGLASATTYYYRVRADKASVTGQGNYSNTISVYTPSNESRLSNLVLSAGTLTPAFASNTSSYTLSTAAATTTVTPTLLQANATVRVNGTVVANGAASGTINLNPGLNTITVLVTAQDGTTTTTYSVAVTRTCTVTAVSRDVAVSLGADGTVTVPVASINNGSSSTCGAVTLSIADLTERISNGELTSNTNGWTISTVDANGGWRNTGGNPGGYVILNSNGASATDPSIAQTVTGLTPGATYTVSGSLRNGTGYGNPPIGVALLAFDLNGTQQTTFPNPGTTWASFSYNFVAPATSATLAFRSEINGADVDAALDNLSLRMVPSSSPTFTCANVGVNAFQLVVTDAAGNRSTAPVSITVSVPTTPTTTWTGNASAVLSDCANWSFGKLPDAGTHVIIPAGLSRYPTLSSGTLTAADVTIASGSSLTVASGATLEVHGNWTNNGTTTLSGTVVFRGGNAQTLGGSSATTFTGLTVNKTSGSLTLQTNATVSQSLTLTAGTLLTGANKVTLGTTATISESAASYVTGTVETTRQLNAAGTRQAFGNLGLALTPSGSTLPGTTTVRRVTGTALSGQGTSTSIKRYYDITAQTNSGLNVTLEFGYAEAELNGLAENSLGLFRSTTGTAGPWQYVAANNRNASANTVTATGVTGFSVWTLGSSANPLPVELVSFTAEALGAAVQLSWTTAQERNSEYFAVERSTDGRQFAEIERLAAQGTSNRTHAYATTDAQLPTQAGVLYYRLRQADLDGTTNYSPVRTVVLDRAAHTLRVTPNPARTQASVAGAQPNAPVEVYDATGRLLLRTTADASGQSALRLPAGLPSGVYFVRSGTGACRLLVE